MTDEKNVINCQLIPEKAYREKPTRNYQICKLGIGTSTEVLIHILRRRLHTEGFHARTPSIRKLGLSKKYKQARPHYAQTYLNRPQMFWNTIFWSDETKLKLFWRHGQAVYLEEKQRRLC